MNLVIVTGMSGAGKSTAMKYLEDMGYHCIDNLPVPLLENLVDFAGAENSKMDKLAVGIDVRNQDGLEEVPQILNTLKEKEVSYRILFLDAEDSVLVKRYKETRRSHPLAGSDRVDTGIQMERAKMNFLKKQADYIVDTSRMLTKELKAELGRIFVQGQNYQSLYVTILSFGFKYGIPADSDLVMDVRFLPNPYYIPELRPKTGNDKEIQDYVLNCQEATDFMNKFEDLIRFLIPNYIAEGKTQLVISIGCTGGKHRSVTMANELYKALKGKGGYGLKLEHRDILRG